VWSERPEEGCPRGAFGSGAGKLADFVLVGRARFFADDAAAQLLIDHAMDHLAAGVIRNQHIQSPASEAVLVKALRSSAMLTLIG
jgi:hypothetical protein